ncbi:hypothetical protein SPBR_05031 [Sporothrix brasiliensis 5110]|uniref:Acyltransferase MbtK/IucB-like conserved domain-containing protein n=1 Tax=Sporothrix brasiliensis 5110 TaxID=1398154 RepID=A0A0C2FA69_9PEZI|nr:uncharacterized protein SPBR_05031 [Sporothrix brasiliensis 5110]KIH87983.1 hypothetical protein SPBR_05031 [Sporothrix brasiliensis 5110]
MGSIRKDTGQRPQDTTITFRLPDGKHELWITSDEIDSQVTFSVGLGAITLGRWTALEQKVCVSPAMINENVAEYDDLFRFDIVTSGEPPTGISGDTETEDIGLLWTAVYALWLHPRVREKDLHAVVVNSERLASYLRSTGLGIISPFSSSSSTTTDVPAETVFWLHREAFWQGAGAPNTQTWVRSRPEVTSFPAFSGAGSFPSQIGFTRGGNVCTVHPVRPPKPAPGSLLYSRYIVELGEQLRIYHIDASNPVHFEHYARWQNSDRVNAGWRERGSDDHHRKYLAQQLADPHTMSCVYEWDGQLAGYMEIGYVMEDNVACFMRSNCNVVVGEFDQNTHFLVGEEKFRGGKRYQAANLSMKHFAFLRDARTKQIIGEPQIGLSALGIQERFIPMEKKKRFHLPHKTSMLIALQRDRFFQEGHFV